MNIVNSAKNIRALTAHHSGCAEPKQHDIYQLFHKIVWICKKSLPNVKQANLMQHNIWTIFMEGVQGNGEPVI